MITWLLCLGLLAHPLQADELDRAIEAFLRASQSGNAARQEALEALVGLGEVEAVGSISGEFVRISETCREARQRVRELTPRLERREILLEQMKRRRDADEDLAEFLETEEEALEEQRSELAKAQGKLDELEPWRSALVTGVSRLFEAAKDSKRKKAERELWGDVEIEDDSARRLGAVELLGHVGAVGTAVQLQRLIADLGVEIAAYQSRLPKLLTDVRKMEKRLQDEAKSLGGKVSRANEEQYRRVKSEAAELQQRIGARTQLVRAAIDAGALALAREQGDDLRKSMASIVRGMKKAKDRARLDVLALIARTDSNPARQFLREQLAGEKEPLVRAELIDALAVQGDQEIVSTLLERHLVDANWYVKSRSAAALARLRIAAAIPVLIARLEAEEGRLRSDIGKALTSLTGQDFKGNLTLWQRWWKANADGFEVPDEPTPQALLETARESAGMTFFGIRTESRRVLFVLDVSGSMEFSMTPRNNPNDDPGRPYDLPAAGEASRLTAAKRDMIGALGGLRDGGLFNLVLYASDVWTWDDDLVAIDSEVRQEVFDYIDRVEAVGGTNIYGALLRAFEIAGVKGGGEWSEPTIDTIYLLTDGRASVGLTVNPEEILAFVAARNRSAGIVIHTIGLSGAHDAYLLRSLAEQSGGTYVAR
jgi:hypothetical protein